MTFAFKIKPEIAGLLEIEAKRAGQSVQDYAAELFAEAIEDALDAAEADHILANSDPSQRRTMDELRAALYGDREPKAA
jgi:hypothetical protein